MTSLWNGETTTECEGIVKRELARCNGGPGDKTVIIDALEALYAFVRQRMSEQHAIMYTKSVFLITLAEMGEVALYEPMKIGIFSSNDDDTSSGIIYTKYQRIHKLPPNGRHRQKGGINDNALTVILSQMDAKLTNLQMNARIARSIEEKAIDAKLYEIAHRGRSLSPMSRKRATVQVTAVKTAISQQPLKFSLVGSSSWKKSLTDRDKSFLSSGIGSKLTQMAKSLLRPLKSRPLDEMMLGLDGYNEN